MPQIEFGRGCAAPARTMAVIRQVASDRPEPCGIEDARFASRSMPGSVCLDRLISIRRKFPDNFCAPFLL